MTPHSTYLPPHLAAQFAHARTDFRPLRSLAAQEIERLIDFLDALDGDTDLECLSGKKMFFLMGLRL